MKNSRLAEFLSSIDCEEVVIADGLDNSFIGLALVDGVTVAVYSTHLIIEDLMENDKMSFDDAQEFMDYNIIGAKTGKGHPVFLDFIPKDAWSN